VRRAAPWFALVLAVAVAVAGPVRAMPPVRKLAGATARPPRAGAPAVATSAPAPRGKKAPPPAPRPTEARTERPTRPVVPPPSPHAGVEARIAAARAAYQAGRYAEVPTALIKLLAEAQCAPGQLIAVYELLASAYVALGQPELAERCFTELLTRRPSFALDPVRTSPKIRAALDAARLHGAGAAAAAASRSSTAPSTAGRRAM
jgi:hypothetical protein